MTTILPLDFDGPVSTFDAFTTQDLEQSVLRRFLAIAHKHADQPAADDGHNQLNYKELATRVVQLARHLLKCLPPDNSPIALLLGQDVNFPLSMLAVMACGRPYIPLDLAFPAYRNRQILQDAKPCAILTDKTHFIAAKSLLKIDDKLLVIDDCEDALQGDSAETENTCAVMSVAPGAASDFPARADSLAYILYTSGSTGKPKGVYQNQRNLLHDVMQYCNAVHMHHSDHVTLLYSASVNGAIRDIYGALLSGACLHILDLRQLGIQRTLESIQSAGITVYHSVPIVFRQIMAAVKEGGELVNVRLVYMAGDRIDWTDIDTFRQYFPAAALFYTGIGSTENATLYCHWFIPRDYQADSIKVPLGHRLPDRHVRLMNEGKEIVTAADVGEIVVSSRYAALGYWGSDGTLQAFDCDPQDPEARLIHTGDFGLFRADGLLELAGRRDQQVKINGFRVELAEIESQLRIYAGIDELAIVVRRDEMDNPIAIIAYWSGDDSITEADLRQFAQHRLAAHMRPSRFIRLRALPMLANFKIDRTSLSQLDTQQKRKYPSNTETETVTGVAAEIATIYRSILQQDDVPLSADLTTLGADSLQRLTLELELERTLNITIPREVLEKNGSVMCVVDWLATTAIAKTDGDR